MPLVTWHIKSCLWHVAGMVGTRAVFQSYVVSRPFSPGCRQTSMHFTIYHCTQLVSLIIDVCRGIRLDCPGRLRSRQFLPRSERKVREQEPLQALWAPLAVPGWERAWHLSSPPHPVHLGQGKSQF